LPRRFGEGILGPVLEPTDRQGWDIMDDVTGLLGAIRDGDPRAADALLAHVYDELRRLAAAKVAREAPGHTLQATDLVHEAYLQLAGNDLPCENRRHFFGAAAEAMRRVLIQRARRRNTLKRGGGLDRRHDLDDLPIAAPVPDDDLVALDDALDKFAALDPLKAELVRLRYFTGLTGAEAAEVLGISPATADRHWAYARAWLRTEMAGPATPPLAGKGVL